MTQVFDGRFNENRVLIEVEGDSATAKYYIDDKVVEVKTGAWAEDTSAHRKVIMEATDWLSSKR